MGPFVKYLVLLLVVGVVFWLLGARRRAGRKPDRAAPGEPSADSSANGAANKPGKPAPPAALEMVSCAHCGLHLPLAEALQQGQQVYCCEAHRAVGPRKPEGP